MRKLLLFIVIIPILCPGSFAEEEAVGRWVRRCSMHQGGTCGALLEHGVHIIKSNTNTDGTTKSTNNSTDKTTGKTAGESTGETVGQSIGSTNGTSSTGTTRETAGHTSTSSTGTSWDQQTVDYVISSMAKGVRVYSGKVTGTKATESGSKVRTDSSSVATTKTNSATNSVSSSNSRTTSTTSAQSKSESKSVKVALARGHSMVSTMSDMLSRRRTWKESCNVDTGSLISDKCRNTVLWQWQVLVDNVSLTTCDYFTTCTSQFRPRCLPGCCKDKDCQFCHANGQCPQGFPGMQVVGKWKYLTRCASEGGASCTVTTHHGIEHTRNRTWNYDTSKNVKAAVRDYFTVESDNSLELSLPDDFPIVKTTGRMLNREQPWKETCPSQTIALDKRLDSCSHVVLWQWKIAVDEFRLSTCDYASTCTSDHKPACLPHCCWDRDCQMCFTGADCPDGFPAPKAIGSWRHVSWARSMTQEVWSPTYASWNQDVIGNITSTILNRFTMDSIDVETGLPPSHPLVLALTSLVNHEQSWVAQCNILDIGNATDLCNGSISTWQWQITVQDFTMKTCDYFTTCGQDAPKCIPGCCKDVQCQTCLTGVECPTFFPEIALGSATCSINRQWQKCAGQNWLGLDWQGETCCPQNFACVKKDRWHSQCVEVNSGTTASSVASGTTTQKSRSQCEDSRKWQQCAGQHWTGPTCCPAQFSCQYLNDWYSQCKPQE